MQSLTIDGKHFTSSPRRDVDYTRQSAILLHEFECSTGRRKRIGNSVQKEDLVTLTSDIVAAHVSNNRASVEEIGKLVGTVFEALGGLGMDASPETVQKSPVVSVRASVKEDYIVCMECGAKQKTLKRHLRVAHGMTPETYRADYGLPGSYPMTAPGYSKNRSDLAKTLGLGRRSGTGSGDAKR